MRYIKIIAALFVFTIAFCGCKKEALQVHPEMEGHWRTAAVGPGGMIIVITDGKTSTYNDYGAPGDPSSKGTAKLKAMELKIGNEVLTVNEFPHYAANGDYGMTVDGQWLIKSITPRVSGIDEYSNLVDLHLWFADLTDQGFTHGYFRDRVESLDLQYKLQTDPAWITITNWTAPGITNLLAASTYECRIKAHYPWGDSEYSQVITFTTN